MNTNGGLADDADGWLTRGWIRRLHAGLVGFNGELKVDIRWYLRGDDGLFHPLKRGLRLSGDLLDVSIPALQTLRSQLTERLSTQSARRDDAAQPNPADEERLPGSDDDLAGDE